MSKQAEDEKTGSRSVDEILEGDPDREKEVAEELFDAAGMEEFLDAHREALGMLKAVNAHLEDYVVAYEKNKEDREPVEKIYALKISILHSMARRFHPFSSYGKKLLKEAALARKEFEALVGPLITRITKNNIDLFRSVLSAEIGEDILAGRIDAFGAIRTNMKTSYGVAAIAYHVMETPVFENGVLVVDWLFVNKRFRKREVANYLIGELLARTSEAGIDDVTVDIPSYAEDVRALAWIFGSWRFMLDRGINSDMMLQLGELSGFEKLDERQKGVKPLGKKDPKTVLKRLGYHGYLLAKDLPEGYIDQGLSCMIETGNRPSALLLAHILSSGTVRVEYLGSADDDAESDIKLISFFLNKACALPGDTLISIPAESEELTEFLNEVCPKQLGYELVEGVLTAPAPGSDLKKEDIEALLTAETV
jgi:hypothetical protein